MLIVAAALAILGFGVGFQVGRRTQSGTPADRGISLAMALLVIVLVGGTYPFAQKIGPVVTTLAGLLAGAIVFALAAGVLAGRSRMAGSSLITMPFLLCAAFSIVCMGGIISVNRRLTGTIAQLGLDNQTRYEPEKNKACPENLKSLYVAFSMYAENWDGLPPSANWLDNDEITSKVRENTWLHCPQVSNRTDDKYGYAYNDAVAGRKLNGKPLKDMPDAAKTPLLYDSTTLTKGAHDAFTTLPKPGRHGGRNNILYCDGHVEAVAP